MISMVTKSLNVINLLTLIFGVCAKLAAADGEELKSMWELSPSELNTLADLMCRRLHPEFEFTKYVCDTRYWNKYDEANNPTKSTRLQIKCEKKYSITFEITPSRNWQLVVLMPDISVLNDIYKIKQILVKPNTQYEQISRLWYKNYTIWSTVIHGDGLLWRQYGSLLAYDESSKPEPKIYNVSIEFVKLIHQENGHLVQGNFVWNTTGETDSCFDFANTCDKSHLEEIEITPPKQPHVTLDTLPLDDNCQLMITGLYGNTKMKYKTPSCTKFKDCNNENKEPEFPEHVSISASEAARGAWRVRVYWARPARHPHSYNVTLRAATVHTLVVPGNATEAIFNEVDGEGFYNVSIYAIIGNRAAHTVKQAYFPARGRVSWVVAVEGALGGAGGVAAAAALASALLYWVRRWRNKYSKEEDPSKGIEEEALGIEVGKGEDHWEVRSDRVLLHEVIGEGAFGVVRRGTLTPAGKEVAVKMLKDFPSQEDIRSFRSEMELMKSVGVHSHVVSLVGCCSSRRPLIVVEYCSRGDLLSYLRCSWDVLVSKRNAKYYNNNSQSSDYRNDLFKCKLQSEESKLVVNKLYDIHEVCDSDLTTLDLLSFCRQIAMGMEFLASNRVVHRDLAARNILMTGDRTLKIADFGLSRDVYEENQYKQKGNGKMPVKWMALESLTRRIYTTQSDVWSFGVVVWEIVTIGGSPYPDVPAARLIRMLRSGYRMPCPPNCSKQLYEVMSSCWRARPRERPTFVELHARLDELLNSACADQYITLELEAGDAPPTPRPQRYLHMLIRGKRPWSRGESYERPLSVHSNHYSSPPAIHAKTQA